MNSFVPFGVTLNNILSWTVFPLFSWHGSCLSHRFQLFNIRTKAYNSLLLLKHPSIQEIWFNWLTKEGTNGLTDKWRQKNLGRFLTFENISVFLCFHMMWMWNCSQNLREFTGIAQITFLKDRSELSWRFHVDNDMNMLIWLYLLAFPSLQMSGLYSSEIKSNWCPTLIDRQVWWACFTCLMLSSWWFSMQCTVIFRSRIRKLGSFFTKLAEKQWTLPI